MNNFNNFINQMNKQLDETEASLNRTRKLLEELAIGVRANAEVSEEWIEHHSIHKGNNPECSMCMAERGRSVTAYN